MYLSVGRYRKLYFCIFLVFSLQHAIYGQIEANNWFFGKDSGINFSTGYPEVLIGGNIEAPAGCSSISDKNGNLLFYTNGQMVWNKNHDIMTDGFGLSGEIENIQSCIIVPKPNDESGYYIFTTRQTSNSSFASGIYYSEVTFTVANPLGIVINKNQQINDSRTNQITAIHAPDGETIRVIVFGTAFNFDTAPRNCFFIINVTNIGIEQEIKITQEKDLVRNGAMKISPDGTRIAIANQSERLIHFFNFDNEFQAISYDHSLGCDEGFTPIIPYGLEFSPNSKILYYTGFNSQTNYLFQYNLVSDGVSPPVKIEDGTNKLGSLQIGRDGKMYVSLYKSMDPPIPYGFVGVINRPDKPGFDCDYNPRAVNFNGSIQNGSLTGLPNYVASIFNNRIIADDHCVSLPFDFELDSYAPITAVTWDFGDGNTSTSFNPSHQYTVGKDYLLKATIMFKNNPITLFKHISVYPMPDLPPNQTMKQCDLDSDGISIFNLNTIKDLVNNHDPDFKYTFYKNLQDALDEVNKIENPDVYQNIINPEQIFVNIISKYGCLSTSSFFINASYTELSSISTLYTCENSDDVLDNSEGKFDLSSKSNEIKTQFNIPQTSVITFYRNSQDALTLSNSLGLSPILPSGEIWVRVDNQDFSCNGIGSMTVVVNPPMVLDIEERYEFCGLGGNITLDGDASNERWEWKNNSGTILSTERNFAVTATGRYTITAYKAINGISCELTKTFFVAETNSTIDFNVVEAENDQIYVSIKGNGSFEFSLDGIHFFGDGTDFLFREIPAGVYTVYVRDKGNCGLFLTKKVALIGYPKYFSPNADGSNEIWKLRGVSKQLYAEATIHIYDRYGQFLYFMNLDGNQSGWDGTLNGKSLPASDYWYTSIITDKENNVFTKKGHFSLIR